MKLHFRPVDEQSIRTFLQWQYAPPYDVYNININLGDDDTAVLAYFLTPVFAFHAIYDQETGELAAFCSFGPDGQVYGGAYSHDPDVLDIGMGVRPDLTGRGWGGQFAQAVITFACHTFQPHQLRVTIANFNQRAMRVWEKNGFQLQQTFESASTGMPFTIFTRDV